jgi:Ca-activated chloride channel family protein
MTARFALGALGSRPGGLIVYAGDAYEAVDMTGDLRELGQTLSLLEAGTVPDPGARPDRALMLAAHVLRGAEVIAGDVLVFTDGSGLGPETLRAATELKAAGARLSFVALRDVSPQMQSHAALTGGQVFGADEVNALTDWLAQSARPRLERQGYPLLFWHDLGRYLLAFGLLPLLWLFRRGAA